MNHSHEVARNTVGTKGENGFVRFLVRYRIFISLVVFVGLLAEDSFIGIRPHDLFDVLDWHSVVGLVSILLGLLLRSWAAGTLNKGKELTTIGPYRVMRNPLYVGSFLVMIGFCVLIDDYENIWVVMGPMFGLYALKVRSEERKLTEKYGDVWKDYAIRTPRMLARRWPVFVGGEWRLAQWLKNREYHAVAATSVGLIAVQLWHDGVLHV